MMGLSEGQGKAGGPAGCSRLSAADSHRRLLGSTPSAPPTLAPCSLSAAPTFRAEAAHLQRVDGLLLGKPLLNGAVHLHSNSRRARTVQSSHSLIEPRSLRAGPTQARRPL